MVIHHPASQRPPHPTAWGMATGTREGVGWARVKSAGIEGKRRVVEVEGKGEDEEPSTDGQRGDGKMAAWRKDVDTGERGR